MRQLEISFFWPLTEQVPLELDYSNCEKPKLYTNLTTTGSNIFNTGSTYTTQIVGNFSIDADKTTFKKITILFFKYSLSFIAFLIHESILGSSIKV